MTSKKNDFEDNIAFKSFLFCPIPGVDIVFGATVLDVTESAKAGIELAIDAVKNSICEGVSESVVSAQQSIITVKDKVCDLVSERIISAIEDLPHNYRKI